MVDVGPVVLPGSSLLLGHSDTPQRLHDEAFEVFLGHLALAVVEKLLLDVALNDRPETLDGVDLGTIGGLEKQLYLQLRSEIAHLDRSVGRMVVQH